MHYASILNSYTGLYKLLIILFLFEITCIDSQAQKNLLKGKNQTQYFDSLNLIYKQQQLDTLFNFIVKEKKFNGTILIAYQGTVIYKNVAGYNDFVNKYPLQINSSFEIASISKSFTAVSILMLYEQRKIDLNKTVQNYLPDFPYPNISIHQLLCHRSGLPDYLKFAEKYHKNTLFPLCNDSLLRMIKIHTPKIKNLPNKTFEYCNTGYAVLAAIIEKISGMSYSEYLKINIFDRLEMKETFVYQYDSSQIIILGHKSNQTAYTRNFLSGVIGDKGIFSSINDLYLYDQALFSGKLIGKKSLALACSPQNPDRTICNNYGYGFRLSCDEQHNLLIYHGGLWNGNNSLYIHRLYDNTTIIILSNIFNRSFTWRSNDILKILDEL